MQLSVVVFAIIIFLLTYATIRGSSICNIVTYNRFIMNFYQGPWNLKPDSFFFYKEKVTEGQGMVHDTFLFPAVVVTITFTF
jgi:hypothetical protein